MSYHGNVTLSSSAAFQEGPDLPLGLFPVVLQGEHPVYEYLEKILGDNVTFLAAVNDRLVACISVEKDTYLMCFWSVTDLFLGAEILPFWVPGVEVPDEVAVKQGNYRLGTGKPITFASLATPPTEVSRVVRRSASFTCSL